MVGFSRTGKILQQSNSTTTTTTMAKSDTLSWCQISGKIQKNFTVIELTHTHSTSRGISRGFEIFRLLSRPGITMHWRRKKRVNFFMDLKWDLKRQQF